MMESRFASHGATQDGERGSQRGGFAMLYVLHDMTRKKRLDFPDTQFRQAFKGFVLWQRAKNECALWYGSDAEGWKRLYATPLYPTVSRPWR
jgi:hypothetical protein